MDPAELRAYGVFKPVGHMVVSFPDISFADNGYAALALLGIDPSDIHRYSPEKMLAQCAADIASASPAASFGQELNLIKAYRALAEQGYHWLVLRVHSKSRAHQAAELLNAQGAERAELYGRFIIEELIAHSTDLAQVRESPDSGLDAQTASGMEEARAQLRPGGHHGH